MPYRLDLKVALVVLLGYVVVLVTLPYLVPLPDDVSSAAKEAGYNPGVAFSALAVWTVVGLAIAALASRRRERGPLSGPSSVTLAPARTRALEIAVVFALTLVAYCPWFLARHGPYIEDHVLLSVLHRMRAGQEPYVDFEFLYGPLLLYPVHAWTSWLGYSMASYYSFLALLEASTFALCLFVLGRFYESRRARYAAFAVMAVLLLDVLMGVNWNGLRRLAGPLILLFVAHSVAQPRRLLAAGVAMGLFFAYSHDYGSAAFVAAGATCAFMAWHTRSTRTLAWSGLAAVIAVAVWFVTVRALLGDAFDDYIALARELVERYSRGEASLRFYWTANSLAAFGLLALSVAVVGASLLRGRRRDASPADAFLLASLVYALIGLKSGINRCDFWHLDAPFLGLTLAWLLPRRERVFEGAAQLVRPARALIVVLAATWLLGNLPSASFVASGYLRGARDVLGGAASSAPARADTRTLALELEKAEPDPELLALATYLAEPARVERAVLFYGNTWALGKQIGVVKTDYLNDDFLFSDERGLRVRRFLEERPSAYVVMHWMDHARLFGTRAVSDEGLYLRFYQPSLAKELAAWLSTTHYEGVQAEIRVRDARWRRTVGEYVLANYRLEAEFGRHVLLARRE